MATALDQGEVRRDDIAYVREIARNIEIADHHLRRSAQANLANLFRNRGHDETFIQTGPDVVKWAGNDGIEIFGL